MVRIALKTRSDLFVVSETVQEIVILRLGQPIRPEDQVLEIISHLVVYKFLEMMIGAVVRPENKFQDAKKKANDLHNTQEALRVIPNARSEDFSVNLFSVADAAIG
jgi:hypothetical protein